MMTLGLFISLGATIVVLTLVKAENPWKMGLRWICTGIVLAAILWLLTPMLSLIVMVLFIVIWRQSIASLVAKPFMALYTGGDTEPDPHPAYSVAHARRKQAKPHEAVMEILAQLQKFPKDYEGQLLLAEIQAQDLKDLRAASMTIERLCEQKGHAPRNIAFALYSMADWHVKIGLDAEAARKNLEKIMALFPNTEFASGAAHRLAHLDTMEALIPPEDRKKYVVKEGVRNLGLQQNQQPAQTPNAPGQTAGELVKHLEEHPLDLEAREKLAIIYADHYARLDLATDQLEQMLSQPDQPTRLVTHWLNLLADLQIRGGADFEQVSATLHRIADAYPGLGVAQIAENRLARLKLEFKSREANRSVKMGTYEQNLGLKDRPSG
ncbi:MAG TPA: hypothetical protein VLT36_14280 [Candidatus Dormibacteraeota bacterium]|nr:hypothetical protein [Candidatus Dormibacteraeota bacterium]